MSDVANQFSPYLYFKKGELYRPLPVEKYLSVCELRRNNKLDVSEPDLTDSHTVLNIVTTKYLGEFTKDNDNNTFLHFNTLIYEDILAENADRDATCYCKVVELGHYKTALIYFFLYQQVSKYPCCGLKSCLLSCNGGGHLGDVKSVIVYLESDRITSVYYSAHGELQGEFRNADQLEYIDGHPIVYPCLGDHSNYPEKGCHLRIFGVVNDSCGSDILCRPNVVEVYNNTPWCNYSGHMNINGIGSPKNHGWWNLQVPITSNNWFRRLFCYKYW